jgi:hypothetical protein
MVLAQGPYSEPELSPLEWLKSGESGSSIAGGIRLRVPEGNDWSASLAAVDPIWPECLKVEGVIRGR